MKFEYRLNINDLKEANQAYVKKGLLIYLLILSTIFLLTSLIPLLQQGNVSLSEILLSVFLPNLLILGTIYFVVRIFQHFLITRAWKSQPSIKNDISVEATEEGLKIVTLSSESKLKWSFYTHWRETQHLFMVYQSHNCFNLFPKRAFSDDEQVNQFRELLRINLLSK